MSYALGENGVFDGTDNVDPDGGDDFLLIDQTKTTQFPQVPLNEDQFQSRSKFKPMQVSSSAETNSRDKWTRRGVGRLRIPLSVFIHEDS